MTTASWRPRWRRAESTPSEGSEDLATDPREPDEARGRSPRRGRFGLLLTAIVAVFLVQGIATPGRWEQPLVSALLGVTFVLALRVGEVRRQFIRPAAVLAGGLVGLSVVEAIVGNGESLTVRIGNTLLVLLGPPAIAAGTIRTMRHRQRVTVEAVLGVLCLYLMIGLFFASIYGLIGHINGTFFAQELSPTAARTLYFSFTTLTTVGYGDLTATSNLGHTLSVSEALVGQIYLVTVVSLIVSNLGVGRRTRDPLPSRD